MATNSVTHVEIAADAPPSSEPAPLGWPERLRRGIWPRSSYVWILTVYLALLIVRPWEVLIPELSTIRFEQKLVLVMLAVALAAGGIRVHLSLIARSLLVLFGTIWLTSKFAYDKELASTVTTEMLGMVLCYFFCVTLVRSPYQLMFIVCAYVLIVFAYLAKSQWEYFLHGAGEFRMGVMRLRGIDDSFGHPNEIAYTALYTLPFGYFLWRIRQPWSATWPGFWRRNFRYALLANFVICGLTILLTRSRAGAMGGLLFLLLLAARQASLAKKVQRAALLLLLCVAGLSVLPADMRDRIQSIWDSNAGGQGASTSAEGRWYGFLAGMEMLHDRPWFGVGIGCFKAYRAEHCTDRTHLSAHNLPGELLGELGIVGAIVFCYALYAIVRTLSITRRNVAELTTGEQTQFAELLLACRDCLWMLAFGSLSLHTLQRYQWFLVAAFVTLSARFVSQMLAQQATHLSNLAEPLDDPPMSAGDSAIVPGVVPD